MEDELEQRARRAAQWCADILEANGAKLRAGEDVGFGTFGAQVYAMVRDGLLKAEDTDAGWRFSLTKKGLKARDRLARSSS